MEILIHFWKGIELVVQRSTRSSQVSRRNGGKMRPCLIYSYFVVSVVSARPN